MPLPNCGSASAAGGAPAGGAVEVIDSGRSPRKRRGTNAPRCVADEIDAVQGFAAGEGIVADGGDAGGDGDEG